MTDVKIIELFFARRTEALSAANKKYGKYCFSIAYNILHSREDSDECVNDTLFIAWNSIPPKKPNRLSAYLGRLTRNIALNRYKIFHAKKQKTIDNIPFKWSENVLNGKSDVKIISTKSKTC